MNEIVPIAIKDKTLVKTHKVVALVYDNLCIFEFGIVAEIFGLERPEFGQKLYDFKSVSLEMDSLRAAGGLAFTANGTLDDLCRADTIIVPGWRGKDAPVPASMCAALVEAQTRGVRIVSICSGIYVLAAAGLLDGREATTHWRYLDDFGHKFPHVNLLPNALYVNDGQIVSSAGSSAGIDMCLHLVKQDFGAKIANSVARRLVMHAHRQGGQTQFIEQPVPMEYEANRLSNVLDYIRASLEKPHSVAQLAKKSGMSVRSFQRKFVALTGVSVGRWIFLERMSRACTLLENSKASIQEIANTVGVPNVQALQYGFRQSYGISPGQYRKRFTAQS